MFNSKEMGNVEERKAPESVISGWDEGVYDPQIPYAWSLKGNKEIYPNVEGCCENFL